MSSKPLEQENETISESDFESLKRAKLNYSDLMELIGNLSLKVAQVGQNHEQEFLTSYRVHQVNIQLELKELKQKVANAQESLSIDGDVAKQEEECAWFRSETVRLDTHYKNMRSDLRSMIFRLHTLNEQISYLSDQLKTLLKRTKILEAEIKGIDPNTTIFSKKQTSNSISNSIPKSKLAQSFSEPVLNRNKSNKFDTVLSSEKLLNLQKSQSRNSLKINKMASSLNHQVIRDLNELNSSQNEFISELEDSIKSNLNNILNRRNEAVINGLKTRKSIKTQNNNSLSDTNLLLNNEKSLKCKDIGLSGLGLQNFMPTDKFYTLLHFLSKPSIFATVVNEIKKSNNFIEEFISS